MNDLTFGMTLVSTFVALTAALILEFSDAPSDRRARATAGIDAPSTAAAAQAACTRLALARMPAR